jgi:hypothetical protein
MSIKFEIYRDGVRVTAFEPVGATAVGPESVPIPGDVAFHNGLLTVSRIDEGAAGVSLLWDAGAAGQFILETTRLQPRPEPYVLNVELVRFRLMKIIQKQEDWNLFDFPKAERYTARLREAQMLFASALGSLHEPAEAAKLADEALAVAIELSEQLAIFHADLLINRRRASGAFVKHIFGCRADADVRSEKYRDALAAQFDYAILPMTWKRMQPQEQTFVTEQVDSWIEYLSKRRIPVIGGPLICLDDAHMPDWAFIFENDFDTLREMAYEYVHKVTHRYRKAVAMWNVCAGLHKRGSFGLTFEQTIELTRLLVSQVKTIIPGARTLITVTHAFGEYNARSPHSVPPMLYAEMVTQAGITFEAFGLELEMGIPAAGHFTRDLFQLSCLLDKFSTLGRPVFLTGICAPGRAGVDPSDISDGRMDPARAGRWRRPWDPKLQAEWMEAVYHLALSKPYVESIAWSNLADLHPTMPGGGLLDDALQPKPSFLKLQEMREKFKHYSKR